jgi:hypothetical protein
MRLVKNAGRLLLETAEALAIISVLGAACLGVGLVILVNYSIDWGLALFETWRTKA